MEAVGSYEAKTHLPKLLSRVAGGEQFLITNRGKPVALLSPAPREFDKDTKSIVEQMLRFRDEQGPSLEGATIKELVAEGRRY